MSYLLPNPCYRGGQSSEDTEFLENARLYEQLRGLKPNLLRRRELIISNERHVELREELDDIQFYLDVIRDPEPDRTHGVDAVKSFIDKIYDMERKNPTSTLSVKREPAVLKVNLNKVKSERQDVCVAVLDDEISPWEPKSETLAQCTWDSWSEPSACGAPKPAETTEPMPSNESEIPLWLKEHTEKKNAETKMMRSPSSHQPWSQMPQRVPDVFKSECNEVDWLQRTNVSTDILTAAGIDKLVERRRNKVENSMHPFLPPRPPLQAPPPQASQDPDWLVGSGSSQPFMGNSGYPGNPPVVRIPRERVATKAYIPNYGTVEFLSLPQPAQPLPEPVPQSTYHQPFRIPLQPYEPQPASYYHHQMSHPDHLGGWCPPQDYPGPRDRFYELDPHPRSDPLLEPAHDDCNDNLNEEEAVQPRGKTPARGRGGKTNTYIAPGRSRYFNDPRVNDAKGLSNLKLPSFKKKQPPPIGNSKKSALAKLRENIDKNSCGLFKLGQKKIVVESEPEKSPERDLPSNDDTSNSSSSSDTSQGKLNVVHELIKEVLKEPLNKKEKTLLANNEEKMREFVDKLMPKAVAQCINEEKFQGKTGKKNEGLPGEPTGRKKQIVRNKRVQNEVTSDIDCASSVGGIGTGSDSGSPGKKKKVTRSRKSTRSSAKPTNSFASDEDCESVVSGVSTRSSSRKSPGKNKSTAENSVGARIPKKNGGKKGRNDEPVRPIRKRVKPLDSESDGEEVVNPPTPVVPEGPHQKEQQEINTNLKAVLMYKKSEWLKKQKRVVYRTRLTKDGHVMIGKNDIVIPKGQMKVGFGDFVPVKVEKQEPADVPEDCIDGGNEDDMFMGGDMCEAIIGAEEGESAGDGISDNNQFNSVDVKEEIEITLVEENTETTFIQQEDAGESTEDRPVCGESHAQGNTTEDFLPAITILSVRGNAAASSHSESVQEQCEQGESQIQPASDLVSIIAGELETEELIQNGASSSVANPSEPQPEPLDDESFEDFLNSAEGTDECVDKD